VLSRHISTSSRVGSPEGRQPSETKTDPSAAGPQENGKDCFQSVGARPRFIDIGSSQMAQKGSVEAVSQTRGAATPAQP